MTHRRSLNDRIARDGIRLAGAGITIAPGRAPAALRAPVAPKTTPDTAGGADGPLSPVLASMSEKQFQAMVVAGLKQRGYVVLVIPDMRKSEAGWPDLAFWHPERTGRLWAWELKREGRYPTPKQRATLACLSTVDGIDARVVRPSDWPALRDALDRWPGEGG